MSRLYEREQTVAIQAVTEAARLCRAVARKISPEVLAKKDKSPVTVADFGSQALICRTLAAAFPDDPVIAEEDAAELKTPENSAILQQVLRHVRNLLSEPAGGAAKQSAKRIVCGWIDHGGGSQYSSDSGRSTRSTAPRGFSVASNTRSALRPHRGRSYRRGRAGMPQLGVQPDTKEQATASAARCDFPRRERAGGVCLPDAAGRIRAAPVRLEVSHRDRSRRRPILRVR